MAGKMLIADIRDREKVSGHFLVQQKQVPLNKNGKPYLALTLMDRSGQIEARMWDNVEQFSDSFDSGDIVELEGAAVSYQGKVQLKVNHLSRLDKDSVNMADFLPTTSRDRDEMLGRMHRLLESISRPELRRLVLEIIDSPEVRRGFFLSPAAKSIHHAWVGGLLEHTLQVMELCDAAAARYPEQMNRDLLLAGAFLHDIGKIRELSLEAGFDYTDEGRLLGHIVIGAEMVTERAARHPGLDAGTVMKLVHLVLSHHGSFEFGSPRRPKIPEAFVLHYLDEMDSKLQAFFDVARQEPGKRWSSYQRVFDRYLLLGEPEPVVEEGPALAREEPRPVTDQRHHPFREALRETGEAGDKEKVQASLFGQEKVRED